VQKIDMQEIEQQHKQLIALLNELNAAAKRWESRETLLRMIEAVIAYTKLHFSTEEQLMLQCAFPGIESHKALHQQLVADVLHLQGKLEYVGEKQFTEWFDHWPFARVLAHIQYADKQLENHIAKL